MSTPSGELFYPPLAVVQDIREGKAYRVEFWLQSADSQNISIAFTSADREQVLAQKYLRWVFLTNWYFGRSQGLRLHRNCTTGMWCASIVTSSLSLNYR